MPDTIHSRSPAGPFAEAEAAVAEAGLIVLGALHPARHGLADPDAGTLILLGTGSAFWALMTAAPEYRDGEPDPIDRWSLRIGQTLAAQLGATAYFPFGGPPYAPFVTWALASGRAFVSPARMLVHDAAGMMLSYRAALHFGAEFDIPSPPLADSPCASCADRPCLNSCPAGALTEGEPYDLAACHAHLASALGQACMEEGCLARRACPLSRASGRDSAQTAHHMRYFHPR
ncbi:ferredoxin [Cribrihabitans neustonicus]|uniref:ferredoxin n=1 Tax=Cribrihabitans neustonicus TaxID=1429085 RepID=UPI003B5A8407